MNKIRLFLLLIINLEPCSRLLLLFGWLDNDDDDLDFEEDDDDDEGNNGNVGATSPESR